MPSSGGGSGNKLQATEGRDVGVLVGYFVAPGAMAATAQARSAGPMPPLSLAATPA